MDLEALQELLAQISGEEGFERGREYSVEITEEVAQRIFGEELLPGAVLTAKLKLMQVADCQYLTLDRKLQCLPGGKGKLHEK